MNTKIREYIDQLFLEAPKTKKALELKEEMISNAEEKFADLLREGYREEDAFGVVVHSIGNVDELFQELAREDGGQRYTDQELELQHKKAKYIAISVGMYVFALAVFFLGAVLDSGLRYVMPFDMASLGMVAAILLCIAPTVLIVYASQLTPRYRRNEDSMVEEYKEWKSGTSHLKEVRKAISSILWTVTVIVYFLISFSTMAWHVTWVIFLIAGCVESVVSLIFSMKR